MQKNQCPASHQRVVSLDVQGYILSHRRIFVYLPMRGYPYVGGGALSILYPDTLARSSRRRALGLYSYPETQRGR